MAFQLASIILYFIVGLICFTMAAKTLAAKKFLTFHEEAAAVSWDKIDRPLQDVILAAIRISGLGFLITGLLLTVFPAVNYFQKDVFVRYAVPILAILFSSGLFAFNYILYKRTGADTPWKPAIAAVAVVLAGMLASIL